MSIVSEFVGSEITADVSRGPAARLNEELADFLGPHRMIPVVANGTDLEVTIEDLFRVPVRYLH